MDKKILITTKIFGCEGSSEREERPADMTYRHQGLQRVGNYFDQ